MKIEEEPLRSAEVEALCRTVVRRVALPLILMYFIAFLDRVNISFAAVSMNRDLGISNRVFGIAAGVFFLGYLLLGVPSSLGLKRFGARAWLSCLMVVWGGVSLSFAFVRSVEVYVLLRFLLGAAEAGFFPGVIYYLSGWLPADARARLMSVFIAAIPVSMVVGAPISAHILGLGGLLHLNGWQLLFVLENVPAIVLGCCLRWIIPQDFEKVQWLSAREKSFLARAIESEQAATSPETNRSTLAGSNWRMLLFSTVYFFMMVGLYELGFWIPKLLSTLGTAAHLLGWSTAIPFACGALGMIVWSGFADRSRTARIHLSSALLVCCTGFALAAICGTSRAAIATLSVAAIGTFAAMPIFWALFTRAVPQVQRSTGIAFVNSMGNLGGFAGPAATGALLERTHSYSSGLVVSAIGLGLAAGLTAMHGSAMFAGKAEAA